MKITKNIYIGIFAFTVIAVSVWGFNFLKGHKVFQPKLFYYAEFDRVGGLIPSNRVSLKGFKVGQVEKVYFDTTDFSKLIVQIYLEENIKIPKGSIAKIISADLMGTKEIELILSKHPELHQPFDTLNSEIEKELMEEVNAQIAPLKFKAEELISSFDSVIVGVQSIFTERTIINLRESFAALGSSMKDIEKLSRNISDVVQAEKASLQSLIKNFDSLSIVLANNTDNLDKTLINLALLSDSLASAPIKKSITELEKTLSELAQITAKINNGEGSMGLLINDKELYDKIQGASKELEALLEDLRKNPSRYINVSVFGRKSKD